MCYKAKGDAWAGLICCCTTLSRIIECDSEWLLCCIKQRLLSFPVILASHGVGLTTETARFRASNGPRAGDAQGTGLGRLRSMERPTPVVPPPPAPVLPSAAETPVVSQRATPAEGEPE